MTQKEPQPQTYKVTGMTCAACASSVESYLKPLNGIESVRINYPNQSVQIAFDESQISLETIRTKTNEIGYNLLIGSKNETQQQFEKAEKQRLKTLKKKFLFSAVFSTPIFVLSMFLMGQVPYENWIMLVLTVPVLFWSGSEFFIIAYKKLKQGTTNMDTLVALSTGAAFLFSTFNTIYPQYFLSRNVIPHVYYESAVVIITLILLGRFLEEKAKSRTSSAIKKLMGLQPKTVTAIRNGEEVSIPFDEILKGELLIIKPGDKIPVDGKVKKGESFIDESMITGEPIPVEKTKKSFVYSGTINQKGSLRILATKVGQETLLSQIIQLVEKAQSSKPKIQRLADKVAGIFVPIVIGIACLTFGIWYILGPQPTFTYSILALITVLIIACPCALGLATPTALMVGIGKGAEQGILIKDAQALETAYKIDTLILDKTGTITEGKPNVTDVIWSPSIQNSKTIENAIIAIESQSEHPLAEAICQHLNRPTSTGTTTESFESITGMGAKGIVDRVTYWIGNEILMQQHSVVIPIEIAKQANQLKSEAKTVVYIGIENTVKGLLAIADTIKPTTYDAIKQIQHMGIEIHMLTGDNEQTAQAIAKQVGIKSYQADILPSDKGNFVEQLQQKGKVVAMAGDGINDSHALAQADVGIAMGTGTDITMESAGITLMHSDLQQIAKAIKLSQATIKTIRQNLFWAFIYNIIAIPVAAGALYPNFGFLLSPMLAGAAMSMSSISVLANSLRLKNSTI